MAEESYGGLLQGDLAEIDRDTDLLIGLEEERQEDKLVLIPSESICPKAVREALQSVFTNIYAEGSSALRVTTEEARVLSDTAMQLAYHRRYADGRFYAGCELVDVVESLAKRRVAELFANDLVGAAQIFANVQPLSGAAANNAALDAFLQPGDTLMGMNLTHGGHLSHGSPYHRSGRYYRVVPYGVNLDTGRLDYAQVDALAREHKPKLIIAGASAYPWDIDWGCLRRIADEVGALLMADIAHPAGLVVAGKFPNPVGCADITTFTTHKTLLGPRGAVILTTAPDKAKAIDRAVFPGEQGGPHINKIAAMAVAFKIARTQQFRCLQERIVENAQALADALQRRGLPLAYGGTNTHLLLIDLNGIDTKSYYPLKGDMAARILDCCGLVCNKNTIPGDVDASQSSAIRLGTVWVTQRGMTPQHMERIAQVIHQVLTNMRTFHYIGPNGELGRAKMDLEVLEDARRQVAELAQEVSTRHPTEGSIAVQPARVAYPRVTSLRAEHRRLGAHLEERHGWLLPLHYGHPAEEIQTVEQRAGLMDLSHLGVLEVRGERAQAMLQEVTTNDVVSLQPGQCHQTLLLDEHHRLLDDALLLCLEPKDPFGWRYLLVTNATNSQGVQRWLLALSDGYIHCGARDIYAKIEGPVVIERRPLAILGLHGPRTAEILAHLSPPCAALQSYQHMEVEIGEGRALVARIEEQGFQFYANIDQAASLWSLLLREGEAEGLRAVGLLAHAHLRDKANLPLYQGEERPNAGSLFQAHPPLFDVHKPYFIGQEAIQPRNSSPKQEFTWLPPNGEPRPSCLLEEHLKLTNQRNIITFAGWRMPVWYTSTNEEHQAVRQTAALFDVSHMGVLDISGPNATRFLDLVITNYVRRMGVGQSQYSYILDPNGVPMDDVFVYRLGADRYMMVVNAVNTEKIKAWLDAVNSRQYVIDREHPYKEVDATVWIRDLKDPRWGQDCKVDLSLQGPNALALLLTLVDVPRLRTRLATLQKFHFMESALGEVPVIVSRTGYTGEETGFELFVHPEDAPVLWRVLLEKGQKYGLKPAGLGARDSARTEAGFPLYGQELAGPWHISPTAAGYGAFVKLHKPFFIGRQPYLEQEMERTQEIVRFRMSERGVRMARQDDPVVNRRGVVIGVVTSCVLTEGYQLGLAYVDRRYASAGTRIGIFPLPRDGSGQPIKPVQELALGDQVPLHQEALIINRFYQRPERVQTAGQG